MKSVVTKVTLTEQTQDDEIDKSINTILNNETALERVMKNCMPAFLEMSRHVKEKNDQHMSNQPSTSYQEINPEPVLARGELDPVDTQVNSGLTNLTIQEAVPANMSKEVPSKDCDSEVTLYRRGCKKVGEQDQL